MMRLADGRARATIEDALPCDMTGAFGLDRVPDCPCGGCMWTAFILEDPLAAGASLEASLLVEEDEQYHPPLFVRGLLRSKPWLDWMLLLPPSQRLWLLDHAHPELFDELPAWAWKALREEGEVA